MNTLIIIIVIIVWTVNHLLLHLKGYRIFDPPFAFHISWIPIAFTTFLLPEIFHRYNLCNVMGCHANFS